MDQFAENYAKKGIVRLKEIFTPGTLMVPKTQSNLEELESIHKVSLFAIKILRERCINQIEIVGRCLRAHEIHYFISES